VTDQDSYIDEYEVYEELFNPLRTDRQARRRRKPEARHVAKRSHGQIIVELADETSGLEGGFHTSYQPSRYEKGWLLSSLRAFYDQGLITDVLALVKGGKEASVYRCAAHPATGMAFLAAKVYRPRMFRNLRNDAMYRQGREILTPDGRPAGRQADRIRRAIRNKTAFGAQAQHTSWLMYEHMALERLHQAGAAVPRPVAASENAVLMSYHGDAQIAAPTLNTVSLERDEAERLFREVMRNVELMLQQGLVHGDLSAYNILYWVSADTGWEITVIDFPQVTDLYTNNKARFILERDIHRTCDYFAHQGVPCDPTAIVDDLWARYGQEIDPDDLMADLSRLVVPSRDPMSREAGPLGPHV